MRVVRRVKVTERLGIIGGLGPIASAYFYQLILDITDASTDQEHIEMIIYNNPKVPDRTNYILNHNNDNPVKDLIDMGKKLELINVDLLTMPCITGHFFYNELIKEFKIPMLNMIEETALYLHKQNIRSIGLMATEGTIASKILQNKLTEYNITTILPEENMQLKVMKLIYDEIKANNPVNYKDFFEVSNHLKGRGAELVLLGCTELSLIKRDIDIGHGFLDMLEVLAKKSIELCGGKIKSNYNSLIS